MSCFILPPTHFASVAKSLKAHGYFSGLGADILMSDLQNVNHWSYMYRYAGKHGVTEQDLYGANRELALLLANGEGQQLTKAELLMALSSINYQSCEIEHYNNVPSVRILTLLIEKLEEETNKHSPEYNAADTWVIGA